MSKKTIKFHVYSNKERVIILNIDNQRWIRLNKTHYEKLNDSNEIFKIIDKHGLFQEKENVKETFKSIYLIVTKKCNMSCDFCFMNSSPNVDTKEEMTVYEFIETLSPYIHKDINKVVVSGGEPLIKKDIFILLNWLYKLVGKEKIILQTNGLLLSESYLSKLEKYIFALELSIESIAYDDVFLKRIDKLGKAVESLEIKLAFSYVVDFDNIGNLKNALSLAKKYNAGFQMRLIEPIGRAQDDLIIDWHKYYSLAILAYKKYAEFVVQTESYDEPLFGGAFTNLLPQKSCGAYGNILSIHPNGDIFPCGSIYSNDYRIGNILKQNVNEVAKHTERFFLRKDIKQSFCIEHKFVCENCEYQFFCNGICGAIDDLGGKKEYVKYQCSLRKDLLYFEMFIKDINWSKEEYCKNFLEYVGNIGENRYEIKYEEKVYEVF